MTLHSFQRTVLFFLLGCVSDLPVLSQQLQGHVMTDFPPVVYTRNVQEKVTLHSANVEASRYQTSSSIPPRHETPSFHQVSFILFSSSALLISTCSYILKEIFINFCYLFLQSTVFFFHFFFFPFLLRRYDEGLFSLNVQIDFFSLP